MIAALCVFAVNLLYRSNIGPVRTEAFPPNIFVMSEHGTREMGTGAFCVTVIMIELRRAIGERV